MRYMHKAHVRKWASPPRPRPAEIGSKQMADAAGGSAAAPSDPLPNIRSPIHNPLVSDVFQIPCCVLPSRPPPPHKRMLCGARGPFRRSNLLATCCAHWVVGGKEKGRKQRLGRWLGSGSGLQLQCGSHISRLFLFFYLL
jgi:hypothetical protein